MVLIDIDDDLKVELENFVKEHSLEFPTMKHFANTVIKEKLNKLKKKEEKNSGDINEDGNKK